MKVSTDLPGPQFFLASLDNPIGYTFEELPHPQQDNLVNKSASVLAHVQAMEAALGRSETDMEKYFHPDFTWDGNRGCGVKEGLAQFRIGWQTPFREAFSDRTFKTETWLADGEWVACFGRCEATLTAEFMGIKPKAQRVCIPYIDFWRVVDGLIVYNKVSVDFADVAHQLGVDVFQGHGWEWKPGSRGETP